MVEFQDASEDDNPYAVTSDVTRSAPPPAPGAFVTDPRIFYVEGDQILCGSSVELPPICVRTGETDDLVEVNKKVFFLPPWARWLLALVLLGILGILIVLVVQMSVRKPVQVRCWLSRRERTRKRLLIASGALSMIASIPAGIIAGLTLGRDLEFLGFVVGIVMFVGGIILLSVGQSLLSSPRWEQPGKFWLKGCKQPFFNELRRQVEAGEFQLPVQSPPGF